MTARIALAAALLAAPALASAYTDADYCRDTARADRQACHAQHLDDLAICLDTYAFGRWIGDEDAGQTVVECRADADAACRDCKADVPACEVQP